MAEFSLRQNRVPATHQLAAMRKADQNRPHDPNDPGPYGTPGWAPDKRTGRHRRNELPDPLPAEDRTLPKHPRYPTRDHRPAPEHRFSNLREQAFTRFMIESAELRAAHFQPAKPYLRERALHLLRCLLAILTCGFIPMPRQLKMSNSRRPSTHKQPATTMATAINGAHTARNPHWRNVPRQHRPSPTYQPSPYITVWEQAFDATTTLTLGRAA